MLEAFRTEIGQRFVVGLHGPAGYGVAVCLALGLLALLVRRVRWPILWKPLSVLVALGAAAFSVRAALAQAWLADDAFITFRYARNLAEGNGLVFNVGERVEGYTNFLWTVLLAFGEWVGVSSPRLSTAMTLGAVVAFAALSAWKLSRPGWIPLAPVLLVLSPAFIEFGTSGLEAGPAALSIGLAALALLDGRSQPRAAWWVLTAALLRPDHAIFFAPLGLVALTLGRRMLKHVFAAGFVFGLYWLGRWAYFGSPVPNTFLAKSGAGAYWDQGAVYWGEFVLATGLWLALPLVLLVAGLLWLVRRGVAPLPRPALAFSLLGAALFTTYIARVGGDFMEFRFGLTTLVLVALAADAALSSLAAERAWKVALAVLAIAPLGLTPRLINDGEKKWHLARESSFYRVKRWSPLEVESGLWAQAVALASLPEQGAKAPPLAAGCVGMVGYLSRVPIIDRYGLTNAAVAKKPIEKRGRPGHEKWGTLEDLLAEGAQWSVDPGWPAPLEAATRFRLGNADFWVWKHTAELAAQVPGLPNPRAVLGTVRSAEEAREKQHAAATLYGEQRALLTEFFDRWGLVDLGQFTLRAPSMERTVSSIVAKDSLELEWQRPCPEPMRLTWTVEEGTCTTTEAACAEGTLEVKARCTGPLIRLSHFALALADPAVRLQRALPLGADAIATVLRADESLAEEGLVARFRFDDPLELTRDGLTPPAEVYDVTRAQVAGQAAISGIQGAGFLNGFVHGDGPTGTLRIAVPVEPRVPVLFSFLFAGGVACDRISARVLDDGRELGKACARQDEVLRPYSLLVTPRSSELVLEVIDSDDRPWGHALLDDVLVWRLPAAPRAPASLTGSTLR